MQRCSPSVGLVAASIVSNVWLLTDDNNRRFLIDTGFGAERLNLWLSLARAGLNGPGDLAGIYLTHRHCDHAGNAEWLREKFRCPIYSHQNDARILSGELPAPTLGRGHGGLFDKVCCQIEDASPVRLQVDEAFATGAWRDGLHIYPAFGHTEGSVLIYHESTQTLFTGDALLAGIPPLRLFESLSLAVPAYSLDVAACHQHMLNFLRNPPDVAQLCSGHGPFVGKQVAAKLQRFQEQQRAPLVPEAIQRALNA
jgi:glyoxylase-like metal-dependent hydrolase (beta-lactamase superfamily II)